MATDRAGDGMMVDPDVVETMQAAERRKKKKSKKSGSNSRKSSMSHRAHDGEAEDGDVSGDVENLHVSSTSMSSAKKTKKGKSSSRSRKTKRRKSEDRGLKETLGHEVEDETLASSGGDVRSSLSHPRSAVKEGDSVADLVVEGNIEIPEEPPGDGELPAHEATTELPGSRHYARREAELNQQLDAPNAAEMTQGDRNGDSFDISGRSSNQKVGAVAINRAPPRGKAASYAASRGSAGRSRSPEKKVGAVAVSGPAARGKGGMDSSARSRSPALRVGAIAVSGPPKSSHDGKGGSYFSSGGSTTGTNNSRESVEPQVGAVAVSGPPPSRGKGEAAPYFGARGSDGRPGASAGAGADGGAPQLGAVAVSAPAPHGKTGRGSMNTAASGPSYSAPSDQYDHSGSDHRVGAQRVAGPPRATGKGGALATSEEDARVGAVSVHGAPTSGKAGGKGSEKPGPSHARTEEDYDNRIGAMLMSGGQQQGKNANRKLSMSTTSDSYDGKPPMHDSSFRERRRAADSYDGASVSGISVASVGTSVATQSASNRSNSMLGDPVGERSRGTSYFPGSTDPYERRSDYSPGSEDDRSRLMQGSVASSFASRSSHRSDASTSIATGSVSTRMSHGMSGMSHAPSQESYDAKHEIAMHLEKSGVAVSSTGETYDQDVTSHQPYMRSNIADPYGDPDGKMKRPAEGAEYFDTGENYDGDHHRQLPPTEEAEYEEDSGDHLTAEVTAVAGISGSGTTTEHLSANPYDAEHGEGPIYDAPVSADDLGGKNPFYRTTWFMLIAAVVLVGAVVGGVVPFIIGGSSEKAPAPTPAPTQTPDDPVRRAGIREILSTVTDPEHLDDEATPQYAAFDWLVRRDELTSLDAASAEDTEHKIIVRYALATLYFATNGKGWFKNFGWLDGDQEECEWENLSCINKEIISLDMGARNNLRGHIPSEIRLLTALRSISMPSNEINAIHGDFGSLPKIVDLDLSGNSIDGPIPPTLYNLSNLRTLNLGNNRLTGTLSTEISSMSLLRLLFLDRNPLVGKLTTHLHGLTNLRDLDISLCGFEGVWNEIMAPLKDIEIMALGDNGFSGTLGPDIVEYSNLEQLDLGSTKLGGTIPSEVGLLTSLSSIFLYKCDLTGTIPSQLANLRKMDELFLEDNNIIGSVPHALCDITVLKDIRVDCDVECACASCNRYDVCDNR